MTLLLRRLLAKSKQITVFNHHHQTTKQYHNNKMGGPEVEAAKCVATQKAIEHHITGDCVLGLGSGSTIVYLMRNLKKHCLDNGYTVKVIPTSYQSKQLAVEHNMPITDLDINPVVDLAIDGADEVDEDLVAIKGGGACLLQEKVVAYAAKKFIVVADHRKNAKYLGEKWTNGIPIEVLPMAYSYVCHQLCHKYALNKESVPIRIAKNKAGPVITDNGNIVLDWKFNPKYQAELASKNKAHWKEIADDIKLIPGVIETGIFSGIVKEVFFGYSDSTVLLVQAPTATRPKTSQLFTGN